MTANLTYKQQALEYEHYSGTIRPTIKVAKTADYCEPFYSERIIIFAVSFFTNNPVACKITKKLLNITTDSERATNLLEEVCKINHVDVCECKYEYSEYDEYPNY